MASNVVNLNRFRKKKEREKKVKQAETNRIRHGRTQAEKDREITERAREARILEGKRLESTTDAPVEFATCTDEKAADHEESDEPPDSRTPETR